MTSPRYFEQGETFPLIDDNGRPYYRVTIRLAWEALPHRKQITVAGKHHRHLPVDFDSGATCCDSSGWFVGADNALLLCVDSKHPGPSHSPIQHSGDNTSGHGVPEALHIDLRRIPPYIWSILVYITSPNGYALNAPEHNTRCQLFGVPEEQERGRRSPEIIGWFNLGHPAHYTANVLGLLRRIPGSYPCWSLHTAGITFPSLELFRSQFEDTCYQIQKSAEESEQNPQF